MQLLSQNSFKAIGLWPLDYNMSGQIQAVVTINNTK